MNEGLFLSKMWFTTQRETKGTGNLSCSEELLQPGNSRQEIQAGFLSLRDTGPSQTEETEVNCTPCTKTLNTETEVKETNGNVYIMQTASSPSTPRRN